MSFDLFESASEKLLLVAHRGACGGNIPCNTVVAYENALREDADMIEIDLDCTADGKLVIFHPGMENAHLGFSERIKRLPWDFVRQLRYINIDRTPTQYGICTFDEVLERFKGRCYINVDKFWTYPREISEAIRAHGMQDQILVKAPPKADLLDIVETYCADMPYMAIIDDVCELDAVKGRKIKFVGTEVLFTKDTDYLASREFIDASHARGELVWCNSIVYNHRSVLAGGHSDDRAIEGDMEGSWGWIADRGFDLMQTDWVLSAANFFKDTNRRFRK